MTKTLPFILLFICAACESKPVKTPPAEKGAAEAAGKATRGAEDTAPNEIFVQESKTPRAKSKLEDAVMTSPATQHCLSTTALGIWTSTFEGKVSKEGSLSVEHFEGLSHPELGSCLKASIAAVSLGKGKPGPFKLQLTTDPKLFP